MRPKSPNKKLLNLQSTAVAIGGSIHRSRALGAIVWFALALSVSAGGMRLPTQDIRATARSNAFVATADNPAAIYYNPAGLIQTEGLEFLGSNYVFTPETKYTAPDGSKASSKPTTFVLPKFFMASKKPDSRWAWGMGSYTPWGQSSDWRTDGPFPTIATRNEILFYTGALAAAYQVTDTLSIGSSVQLNYVKADLRQAIGFTPGDQLRFIGDDTSVAANLGLLWKVTDQHVWGFRYQTHTKLDFSGTIEQRPYSAPIQAGAAMPFPEFVSLAYSFRPTPDWNFEIMADWTNWERLNTVSVDYPGPPIDLQFDWKDSFYYQTGVTYYMGSWSLLGGLLYNENSIPDAVFSPATADSNFLAYSFGVEYASERWSTAVSVQSAPPNSRVVSGSPVSLTGESADGLYRSRFFAVGLSSTLRF